MARYTIRVVLHDNATWEEYDTLHKSLATIGVYDSIQSDDGTWYRLPPAEYNYEGNADPITVRSAVSTVANGIKPRTAVLVTDAVSRHWIGLEQIDASER